MIEKPVFRALLALSMLEIELYQISIPYDRGRSGYEINLGTRLILAFNSRFSHDVTTAMLVPLNKEKAAMLVPQPNPPAIELYYYANASFCFRWKTCLLITWVKTNNSSINGPVNYTFYQDRVRSIAFVSVIRPKHSFKILAFILQFG